MNQKFNTNQFKINLPGNSRLILLLFITIGFSYTSLAQVQATLDTTALKIGEEFQYTIEVVSDSTDTVQFPEGQRFLPLEVIEYYPTDSVFENQKTRLIKKYGLTQFDSGRYVIPSQMVSINNQNFYTDSLLVEVFDVEVDTLKQKMFDIKPAIEVLPVKSNWLNYLFWTLLIVLALILLGYLIFKQKKKIELAKQQLPPFEEALVALQTLDTSAFLRENKIKEYYSGLTEIVKRYLDREVDEAALESTTDELISKLQLHKDAGHLDFDKATINKLREILMRADLIKFAKMQMESGQAQLDRAEIEEIIKETHESIPEPTEEEKLQDERFKEELAKKKRRKKRLLIVTGVAAFLMIALAVATLLFGINQIKDTLLGNYTRSLVEKTWVKSEYGYPAVILESPDVLVRKTSDEEFVISKNLEDIFTFGDIREKIYVYIGSSKTQDTTPEALENIMEEKLLLLEEAGATNLIVMDEPFTTENGINGIKASGEFNISLGENKYKKEKSEYELLIFSQGGIIQEILIVIEKGDVYAQQIKDRILNSVEIEVQK
ncbi:DUF4381 domain-containing protein [Planktosalinus lacus]|uniref:DUF4381 domain-containing protein n=1 Tax=Planktosalinus lacus TaxID=1526573 RepID=A0A8J2V888_9FLAO|nr:DUF4381 domain-containing protein [Planktosalinus lacus]GGD81200.1 hypothetical protein GCM10011312_01920 [Planktosalinus lacus]